MTPDVFYCPPGNVGEGALVIDGEEFSHLVHVMRKKEGDTIVAVDGLGNAWDAVIAKLERRSALCTPGPVRRNHREPVLRVTLAAAVLKNPSRYDFLVEKCVELGVAEIIPMRTGRTIPSHARSERWRKLALAAMKQSGRSFLPPVRDLAAMGDVVDEFGSWANAVVAHEDPSAAAPFGGVRPEKDAGPRLLLMVGPEGGFSPEEIDGCIGRNFTTLCLGERRLRAETAAVAALALLHGLPGAGRAPHGG